MVGGGPTGVELAGALAEIARQSLRQDFRNIRPESARIILIEGGPDLLAAFPAHLRTAARRSLERLGVEVLTGSVVTNVDAEGVVCAPTSRGPASAGASPRQTGADAPAERIDARTVLWAAGVAASPLATSLGVP